MDGYRVQIRANPGFRISRRDHNNSHPDIKNYSLVELLPPVYSYGVVVMMVVANWKKVEMIKHNIENI